MADTDRTVDCQICGVAFDPTAAGGWCTNPDCGEWQHDGDSDDFDAPTTDDTAADVTEPPVEEAATDDAVDVLDEVVDSDDSARETASGAETGDAVTAEPAVDEGQASERDSVGGAPSTIPCPDCGTELDADANFCVECGRDVQGVEPGGTGPLTACPACGADVEADDSFCADCGEDLDAHRTAGQAAEEVPDDPGPTGGAANAPGATDGAADASGGTATASDAVEALSARPGTDDEVPERLVLSVHGREIIVEDGDRVGREIRAALTDAGRPENEAVRIHREHVQFVRESDGFYLVDLGDNPTRFNGTRIEKGDRERVEPGDELELSGVATVTIQVP